MELREGYKQTEGGVIPEDWELKPLLLLTTLMTNGFVGTAKTHYTEQDEGILYIQGYNVEENDFNYNGIKRVTTEFHKLHKKSCLREGDLLTVQTGDVGLTTYVPNELVGSNCHALIITRFKKEKYTPKYFSYYLNSKQGRDRLREIETGTTMKHINVGDMLHYLVPFPPTKTEQTAIANALSDADAWIQSLTRLIAKKRQIKQGAMQTLLNPYENGRLKAGWVVKKLGEIGVFSKGSGVKKDEALSGILPCVRYGEIYTRHNDYIKQFNSFISKDVAATAKRLKTGDLLFAGSGETKEEIGKCVAFIDGFEAYAGGDIVILRPTYMSPQFLGFYLNTNIINSQKASKGQGDAVVHISASALGGIDLTIPKDIKEQTAIATILSDMDSEITVLETKLTKAQQIKQGMMQNLLTGKIRLVRPKARVVPVSTKSPESTKHNEHFNEAVVIAVLADKFGSYEYPLGRKRYTKLSYLLHRYCQESISAYEKKAAGPYNPKTRYSGAEKIATSSQYISAHKNEKFTGFIAAEKIAKAYEYFNIWYEQGALSWLEQFRKTSNDMLELWTTVDMAMVELNKNNTPINLESVKDIIASSKEWKAKLARPAFSDDHIVNAINKSQTLFSF